MTKFLTVVATVISLNLTAYELVDYQDPKEGEQREFYIGDKILISTSGYVKPCIIPLKELEKTVSPLGVRYIYKYKRNKPICKENIKDRYYHPTYSNYFYGGGIVPKENMKLPVSVKEKDGGFTICQRMMGSQGCLKGLGDKDITVDDNYFVHSSEYPVKTISYLGKSKGILKFAYEEVFESFYNPVLRTYLGGDSQTLQFEVDPSESKTFSFKGAVLEIIEESSALIEIKVIRGFPI